MEPILSDLPSREPMRTHKVRKVRSLGRTRTPHPSEQQEPYRKRVYRLYQHNHTNQDITP